MSGSKDHHIDVKLFADSNELYSSMCVCMYMCMYAYVHVYVRVCMCVHVHGASNIVQIMLILCSF